MAMTAISTGGLEDRPGRVEVVGKEQRSVAECELSFEDGNNLLLRVSPPTARQSVNSLKREAEFLHISFSPGSNIVSDTRCTQLTATDEID